MLKRRGLRGRPAFDFEEAQDGDEVERDKEEAEERRGDGSADDAGADGVLAAGSGAGAQSEREHAEAEGDGRHQDWPQTLFHGVDGGVDQAFAGVEALFRELDHQDRVLGGEADDGDEADLEVDVVGQSAQVGGQQHAERAEGHVHHHGERDGPVLIQGGEGQEDHHQREDVERGGTRAGKLLFVGESGPRDADAGWQLLREIFHDLHGFTRAVSGRGFAADGHGRRVVETLELG